MTTIYDSITVGALPVEPGALYLGYIDGNWPTFEAVKARFPNSTVLTVTTNGFNTADICDVEHGDATPEIAAAGVRHGLYKTVYCARENLGELVTAMGNLEWNWFAADWTGVEHLVPGSVATQWAAPGAGSPGNYDISVTNGVWPNPPAPPPAPPDPQETHMLTPTHTGNGYWIVRPDGSVWSYGDAQYCGGLNPGAPVAGGAMPPGVTAISISGHPTGQGYWIYSSAHGVYAFGAAQYHGAA